MNDPVPRPLRILTVCTHNRTRSVMSAAMMEAILTERLGAGAVAVRSSGFGPSDLPAIDDAVLAMRRRGLDVSAHRSSPTTASLVDGADVILTAERDHVVRIAALSPTAFQRAATLPEFLGLAVNGTDLRVGGGGGVGDRGDVQRVVEWVEQLTGTRRAGDYLRAAVPEVADPTGSAPRAFEAAVSDIEQQCHDVAAHLVAAFRSGS